MDENNLEARQLQGKRSVVTGAASGIGAAAAMLFADHGSKVVLADLNKDGVEEVAAAINERHPGYAVPIVADVSSKEDTIKMVDLCISKFGGIDCFYANAGLLNKFTKFFDDEDEDEFMKAIRINTLAFFMTLKYAGKAMREAGNGGSIISNASIAALRSDLSPLQYTASKGALISMVRAANDRFLEYGIRVNAIVPGGVFTPTYMKVYQQLRDENLHLADYPIKKFPPILPDEIARVAVFLASDASSCIKGHTLIADGGMSNSMGSQPYPSKVKTERSKNELGSKL